MVKDMTEAYLRSAYAGESQAHIRYTIYAVRARSTSEDLQAGIDGETFEINEMYPVYRAVAQSQGEKAAETTFTWALEAEKTHLSWYSRAKQAVDQGEDATIDKIQICSTGGYAIEGDAPGKCPICGATKAMFKAF